MEIIEEYYVVQYQKLQLKEWYDTEFTRIENRNEADTKLRYCLFNSAKSGFRFRIVLRQACDNVVG